MDRPDEVDGVDVDEVAGGWAVRIWLAPERMERVRARARRRVSESSCGLCGMDNIDEVLRPLPNVTARIRVDSAAIARSLASLRNHQPLGRETGAVHAAAFCTADGQILCVREDVGRHNALDKLIGALACERRDPTAGFAVVTSRASFEMVQKAASVGIPMLAAVSAPTGYAIRLAQTCGLTLAAFVRGTRYTLYAHPERLIGQTDDNATP